MGVDICGGDARSWTSSNIFETLKSFVVLFVENKLRKIFVCPLNWAIVGGITDGSVNPSSIVNVEHGFFISAYAALLNIVLSMSPVLSSICVFNMYVWYMW